MFITFLILVMDPELLSNKAARANIDTHALDINLFDDIEEGSLLVFDIKTAKSLVAATTHAISSGSLKMVGVLPILDKEAFSSAPILLKLNLALRSFWAAGMVDVKPRTARMGTPRLEGAKIPFEDITWVAAKVSRAFTKLDALMKSTRGNRMMAIHWSGAVPNRLWGKRRLGS